MKKRVGGDAPLVPRDKCPAKGWERYKLRDDRVFENMFPKRFHPTDCQRILVEIVKKHGRGVYIVEERTGRGKTEGALAASYAPWMEKGE